MNTHISEAIWFNKYKWNTETEFNEFERGRWTTYRRFKSRIIDSTPYESVIQDLNRRYRKFNDLSPTSLNSFSDLFLKKNDNFVYKYIFRDLY